MKISFFLLVLLSVAAVSVYCADKSSEEVNAELVFVDDDGTEIPITNTKEAEYGLSEAIEDSIQSKKAQYQRDIKSGKIAPPAPPSPPNWFQRIWKAICNRFSNFYTRVTSPHFFPTVLNEIYDAFAKYLTPELIGLVILRTLSRYMRDLDVIEMIFQADAKAKAEEFLSNFNEMATCLKDSTKDISSLEECIPILQDLDVHSILIGAFDRISTKIDTKIANDLKQKATATPKTRSATA